MEPHDDQEHLRPLSSLTTDELRERLRLQLEPRPHSQRTQISKP